MKKIILIALLFSYLFSFAQMNDTIYYRNGIKKAVYKIDLIENDILYFTPLIDATVERIRTFDISGYFKDNKYCSIKESIKTNLNINTKYLSEIDYKTKIIKYNLGKFYSESRTSHVFYGLSMLTGIVYASDPVNYKQLIYVAAGLGAVGFVVHIDSYKWIKRAAIETTLERVKIKVDL